MRDYSFQINREKFWFCTIIFVLNVVVRLQSSDVFTRSLLCIHFCLRSSKSKDFCRQNFITGWKREREKKQKLFEIKTDSLACISSAIYTSNTCKNVKGEASRRMVGNGCNESHTTSLFFVYSPKLVFNNGTKFTVQKRNLHVKSKIDTVIKRAW